MRCCGGIASRAIFVSFLVTSPALGQIGYTGVAAGVRFNCWAAEGDSVAFATFGGKTGVMYLGNALPDPYHAYALEGTVAPPAPDGVRTITGRWAAYVILSAEEGPSSNFAVVDYGESGLDGVVFPEVAGLLFLHGKGLMRIYAPDGPGPNGLKDTCGAEWTFQGQSLGPHLNPPTGRWVSLQGVEVKTHAPARSTAPLWVATTPCALGTTCFAVPGSSRADLLVRMLPLGGGRVGPAFLPLSASSFDVWTRGGGQANQNTRSWLIPAATTSPARAGLLDLVGHPSAPASTAGDEAGAPDADFDLESDGVFEPAAFGASDADIDLESDGSFEPAAAPPPPSSPWLTTTALPGFRFKARLAGTTLVKTSACAKEAICLAKKAASAPDVVARILKKQPNGKRWSALGKFAQPAAEVWIEQTAKHVVKYYQLTARATDSPVLPGVLDRTAFAP